MKIWLLGLTLLITGCGSAIEVREASTFFASYETEIARAPVKAIELPQLHEVEVRGNEVILTPEAFDALVEYELAAASNTEALQRLSDAYQHKQWEVHYLVEAGKQVEQEAELFRGMYLNEAGQCRFYQYSTIGLGGLSLILTGLAF